MALDKATVARVAHLARIRVDDSELDQLSDELSKILGWVEKLSAVDTENVSPMTSVVEMSLPRRQDVVSEEGDAAAVTGNAPRSDHGFFTVPKVVE